MLAEDYEEERFYVEVRTRLLGGAGRIGAARRSPQTLIDKLEF